MATTATQPGLDRVRAIVAGRAIVRDHGLRDLRVAAGLSQRELADAVGVTGACVSRWESGGRIPRGIAAARLGEVVLELGDAA